MVEILRPYFQSWEVKCTRCKVVLGYEEKDIDDDYGDELIICPKCKQTIWIDTRRDLVYG